MNMVKTVYISGPISGYNINDRIKAFDEVERKLLNEGFSVINPIRENGYDPNKSYGQYMRDDLKLLLDCDSIYMMPEWTNSKGCHTEDLVALTCNIEIIDNNLK